MKYWILGLPLLVMACTNNVAVKDQAEYKCGDQIVQAKVLNDNSMILRINGINHVLSRTISAAGEKYQEPGTGISFTQQDGDLYLAMHGINYPMCQKISR